MKAEVTLKINVNGLSDDIMLVEVCKGAARGALTSIDSVHMPSLTELSAEYTTEISVPVEDIEDET